MLILDHGVSNFTENYAQSLFYFHHDASSTRTYLSLGSNASFLCNITNSPVVWIINNTYYNVNQLPSDYAYYVDSNRLIFFIPVIKLWMNNTKYGCYSYENETLITFAHINVNFGKLI